MVERAAEIALRQGLQAGLESGRAIVLAEDGQRGGGRVGKGQLQAGERPRHGKHLAGIGEGEQQAAQQENVFGRA